MKKPEQVHFFKKTKKKVGSEANSIAYANLYCRLDTKDAAKQEKEKQGI